MVNSDHWLWRHDAATWLNCSRNELNFAEAAISSRRKTLTHLRRCCGMALNAILHNQFDRNIWTREECESAWGRSYLDHLKRFDPDPSTSVLNPNARKYADQLLNVPFSQGPLVQIGSVSDAELQRVCIAARKFFEICTERITPAQRSTLLQEPSD